MENYLYVFVHLPRTGGSTFRKHIEKNIPKSQRLLIGQLSLRLKKERLNKNIFLHAIEKEVLKLGDSEREKMKIIYGHDVPYGIHRFFNKPARYIMFVRDPESVAISLYNFFLTRYQRDVLKKPAPYYKSVFLIDGKIPTFPDWLKSKYGKRRTAVETMSQQLRNLGYLDDVHDRKKYKKSLKKFYYIGDVDHLKTDMNYLFYKLGFNKFFINQNVSRKYAKKIPKDTGVHDLLERDTVFYKMALKRRKEIIKTLYDTDRARFIKIKRAILLPFTQTIFDFKGLLIDLSSLLRRKSKLYDTWFDALRGYRKE